MIDSNGEYVENPQNLIYSVNKESSSAVVKCKLNNVLCNALLDSGAGCSLIDKQLLSKIGNYELINSSSRLYDASGNLIPIDGTVIIPVNVIGTKSNKYVKFQVSNSRTNMVILGRDLMEMFETVTFNMSKKWIKFDKYTVYSTNERRKERIKTRDDVVIPARTEKVVAVKCRKQGAMMESVFLADKVLGCGGVYVASAVMVPNFEGVFHVRVVNTSPKDVTIPKRKRMGRLCPETILEQHNDSMKQREESEQVIGDCPTACPSILIHCYRNHNKRNCTK